MDCQNFTIKTMDTVYPEPMSKIYRRTERRKRIAPSRYRTTPVTFSEIQEVDEENLDEDAVDNSASPAPVLVSQSEHDLKAKLDNVWSKNVPETEAKRPEKKKRTLKSINRRMDKKPPEPSPDSPESPTDSADDNKSALPPVHLLNHQRTSI